MAGILSVRQLSLSLLLLAALGFTGAARAQAEKIALLIGNAAYAHSTQLGNPLNDIAAVAQRLAALGFEIEQVQNGDRRSMGAAITAFQKRARNADTALVYYSGHGMEIEGVNYLIPTDAKLAHSDTAWNEAIPLDIVIGAASRASRLSVVILDACRNNTFPSARRSGAKTFVPVNARPGQVIAYSTEPGAVALDGRGALSPYTQALTEALDEAADLDVRTLFTSLGDATAAYAGAPQRPFTRFGGFPRQTVTLAGVAARAPRPGPISAPNPEPSSDSGASEAWASLQGSRDAEALRAFISSYPDAPERAQADAALAALSEEFRVAQTELKRLGLYRMRVDGAFGDGSIAALKAFEQQASLTIDGVLSQEDLEALKAAPTPERTSASHGQSIRDCDACPEMVVIPGGRFLMGSPSGEAGRLDREGPQHSVTVASFALGRTEVTFAEWDACVAAGGCGGYRPGDEGWGRGTRPVMNVSWEDAQAYVTWLNGRSAGAPYRLPSEAEWEYAARAGTTTAYFWGDAFDGSRANEGFRTVPVGSYAANAFGLHDMHGNVWEWVQDCWNDSYDGAPSRGEAWMSGNCSRAVLRGGSWIGVFRGLRSAFRGWKQRVGRFDYLGFRVARTLPP